MSFYNLVNKNSTNEGWLNTYQGRNVVNDDIVMKSNTDFTMTSSTFALNGAFYFGEVTFNGSFAIPAASTGTPGTLACTITGVSNAKAASSYVIGTVASAQDYVQLGLARVNVDGTIDFELWNPTATPVTTLSTMQIVFLMIDSQ